MRISKTKKRQNIKKIISFSSVLLDQRTTTINGYKRLYGVHEDVNNYVIVLGFFDIYKNNTGFR